jgi:hypothetical protein
MRFTKVRLVATAALAAIAISTILTAPPAAAYLGAGFEAGNGLNGHVLRDQDNYTVRLVKTSQGDIEGYRTYVKRAVAQVTKYSGISFVVAPGTIADTSPDRRPVAGEILIAVDTTSPCSADASWAGCAENKYNLSDDSNTKVTTITGGRMWMNKPGAGTTVYAFQHLVAHELGHVLGLAHFSGSYQNKQQVMYPGLDGANKDATYGDYKQGDINGLRYLHPFGRPWENLGGGLAGDPDAASWAAGRLDVFVRGTDNVLYHRWYDGAWHGFEGLGGTLTSDPTAVSWGSGRIDVFARGTNNHLIHKWFVDGAWSSTWEDLGGVLASAPDAASWGSGHLDVFVRGTDNNIYQNTFNNGAWVGFKLVPGSTGTAGGPSAVSWGANRIDLFARSASNSSVIHKYFANGTWLSSWENLGGVLTSDPDASTGGSSGTLNVFGRGSDNTAYQRSYSSNLGWSVWEQRGGGTLTSGVGAVSWGPSRVDIFARMADNALHTKHFDGSSW